MGQDAPLRHLDRQAGPCKESLLEVTRPMVGNPQNYLAVINVVGIGGGGVNAVNRMIDAGLKGVEFIAIKTDAQALLTSDADSKPDIRRAHTRALGAGSDPRVGRQAAEAHSQESAVVPTAAATAPPT